MTPRITQTHINWLIALIIFLIMGTAINLWAANTKPTIPPTPLETQQILYSECIKRALNWSSFNIVDCNYIQIIE